jgi:4-aminobutyrate aminotransferase
MRAQPTRPAARAGSAPAGEGDVNQTCRRAAWQAEALNAETRHGLDEDARWFLHQSLSTLCLNVPRARPSS